VPKPTGDFWEKFIVALVFCLVAWAFMSISTALAEKKLRERQSNVAPVITIY
jgi:hypothetical protein